MDIRSWSWTRLNATLMDSDEETCAALLAAERAGARRKQFLLRIHSRINKLRAERERIELLSLAGA